jgi:hypothetical protein
MSEDLERVVSECRARFPDPKVELVSVVTRVATFVLRSPTMIEHRAFMAAVRDDAQKGEAFRNLFATICVHPPPPEVTALLDRFGGVLAHAKVQNAVGWLTGTLDELQGKAWPAP